MEYFKDVTIKRSGKTHVLREYELGLSFAQKVQYLIDKGREHVDEDSIGFLAYMFMVNEDEVLSWAQGLTLPEDKNIITVITKYFRFLYEHINGGIE